MAFYISTAPWTPQSYSTSLYGCGPSYVSRSMDMYDLQEALYEQELREYRRRVAMQREIEERRRRRVQQQRIEAMMQRMAVDAAMEEWAEREYVWQRSLMKAKRLAQLRAEAETKRDSQAEAWRKSVETRRKSSDVVKQPELPSATSSTNEDDESAVYIRFGNLLFRLAPQSDFNDEKTDAQAKSASEAKTTMTPEQVATSKNTPSACADDSEYENLVPLTFNAEEKEEVAEGREEESTEPASKESDVNETMDQTLDQTLDPRKESASHDTEHTEKPSTEEEQETRATNTPQLVFSYDFPDANTAYGREVRRLVNADNISVQTNSLNEGSIKIGGLWSKTAPTKSTSRPSSPRSARVRDVDENGDEILLAEDTDSESESGEPTISFQESVVISLPSPKDASHLRAELDEDGFRLWI
ncbi:hypothetical protein MGL_0225 [Malassezia globosa CBS 7966]|uniref:Uncharacterized protein n=1 Tax=Malassezia globosa (strain ATCC MYA-4612 / CBS 7966) TaxID=425265 RepID=A8PSB0_MALGO|nr:uncharacterized protein MGL_0225 [Malassezia globosa CBS 7966]EDP45236.1 hypothetical protein MGL_0225 [Malassezia globosa CBS 7966]